MGRHFSDKEKKENSKETGTIPKTSKAESETTDDSVKKVESPETVEETVDEKKAEETVDEVLKDPEPKKSKNKKKNKNKNKNKQSMLTSPSTDEKNTTPEPEKEKVVEKKKNTSEAHIAKTAEQIKKEVAEYLSKSKQVKNEEESNKGTEEVKLTEE